MYYIIDDETNYCAIRRDVLESFKHQSVLSKGTPVSEDSAIPILTTMIHINHIIIVNQHRPYAVNHMVSRTSLSRISS